MTGVLKAQTAPGVWTPVGAAGITQDDADARYVNTTGDTMTGQLSSTFDGAAIRLMRTGAQADRPHIEFTKTDGSTRMGYIMGEVPGIRVSSDQAATPVKLQVAGADRFTVQNTEVTCTVPLVLPADPTTALQAVTKQYVDMTTGPACAMQANWSLAFGSGLPTRVGKMVTINAIILRSTSSSASPPGVVGTLPFGYRPALTIRFTGATHVTPCVVQITSGGNFDFYGGNAVAAGQYVFVNVTFEGA